MFRAVNPYDELVAKATDEQLTSEDWGLNLELCDKVGDEHETGARNAIAALQKRLAHRNPNVQMFALELTNTLSENCGKLVHQEIASKSFTEGLERIITDRTTNDKVRKKALLLVKKWTETFEEDSDLGLMGELYERFKRNSEHSHVLNESSINEPAPEDLARARAAAEEEEMARVLELSKQDKGGRSYGGGGGASSSFNQHASSSSAAPSSSRQPEPVKEEPPAPPELSQATSVRALYAYTPTNPTELAFLEGDVIKVIGRTYEQWWRGTLRGRVGIFPVNYVESLRSPTAEEMRREREDEDAVFRSVARFDELLERLRGVDVQRGERVEDSREIEELYASCVGMQGKITELIQKYATQKADLEQISSIFDQAARQYQLMKNPPSQQQPVYTQPVPQHLPPQQQQQQPHYAPAGGPSAVVAHPQQQQHPVQDPAAAAAAAAAAGGGLNGYAHPQHSQQQQQHISPEWQAYYAAQEAAVRGQALAAVPGQQPGGAQSPAYGAPSGTQGGAQSPAYHAQQQQQPPYDPRPNVQPQQGPAVLSPDGRPRSYIGQPGGGGGSSYQGYAAPPGGGPSPQQSGYAAPLQ